MQFIGEIRTYGGKVLPTGWAFCQGQALPISENPSLFALIGTTYGGDGEETFNLPDLQGRVPVSMGAGSDGVNRPIGQVLGSELVLLTESEIPAHAHALINTDGAGTQQLPSGAMLAK